MSIWKKLPVATAGAAFVTLGIVSTAQAVTITFDDGTAGSSVGSFYSSQGVTFSNTTFTDNFNLNGTSGSLGIFSTNASYQPQVGTAIVGSFSTPQSFVSIRGIDVGTNGIRIDAHDATSGGNLLGFDEFFGSDVGVGSFQDLSFSAAGSNIRRFEVYQPRDDGSGDGVLFENLSFNSTNSTPVPFEFSPGVGILALGALGAMMQLKNKMRKWKFSGGVFSKS